MQIIEYHVKLKFTGKAIEKKDVKIKMKPFETVY